MKTLSDLLTEALKERRREQSRHDLWVSSQREREYEAVELFRKLMADYDVALDDDVIVNAYEGETVIGQEIRKYRIYMTLPAVGNISAAFERHIKNGEPYLNELSNSWTMATIENVSGLAADLTTALLWLYDNSGMTIDISVPEYQEA